jgi:hypothetical protein
MSPAFWFCAIQAAVIAGLIWYWFGLMPMAVTVSWLAVALLFVGFIDIYGRRR